MHKYPSHNTSTRKKEMDLHSGSKDLTVPSIMFMRFLHGILLSSGKPLGRPPDSKFMGKISQIASPNLDPGGIGALEDKATVLGDLGKLKKEGDFLPLSSSPPFISGSALWEENNGRNGLPTHTFDIRYVKEESIKMTEIYVDASSMVSFLNSLDLYWKSQFLVDYFKDLYTCMILDDQLHEEGYLVHEGVIYNHGRIFLFRSSKLK